MMQSRRSKSTKSKTKTVLITSVFLVVSVNFLFISCRDLGFYYYEAEENDGLDLMITSSLYYDDQENIQQLDYSSVNDDNSNDGTDDRDDNDTSLEEDLDDDDNDTFMNSSQHDDEIPTDGETENDNEIQPKIIEVMKTNDKSNNHAHDHSHGHGDNHNHSNHHPNEIEVKDSSIVEKDYNETEYKNQLSKSLERIPNLKTGAYLHAFWAGFCNQYFMFAGVLLLAKSNNYTQIIQESIRWKDLFGTNQHIRHDVLFDVVHWNTFYPQLPRFIKYNTSMDTDLDIPNPHNVALHQVKWTIDNPYMNATKPYAIGEKQVSSIIKFEQYTKSIEKGQSRRDESEIVLMKSALRPHPAIRDIMSSFTRENHISDSMVLHARIEPDMQKHTMCKKHKVVNMTEIVNMLYEKYPEPPVSTVLIILNREILEKEVADNHAKKNDNVMAVHNLKTLNDMILNGMWNGQVKVIEAGSGLAKGSKYAVYSKYYTLVGSIINFFLSLEAKIFVGTIVSSFSTMVVSFRFFREKMENYFYFPHGLDLVTPDGTVEPPRFAC